MKTNRLVVMAALLAMLSGTASAAVIRLPDTGWTPGGQYSAAFHQQDRYWAFHLDDGRDLVVPTHRARCAHDAPLPAGLWVVVRDPQGRPALAAPSVTELPDGHPGLVTLVVCGARSDDPAMLELPDNVLKRLSNGTGAILVHD